MGSENNGSHFIKYPGLATYVTEQIRLGKRSPDIFEEAVNGYGYAYDAAQFSKYVSYRKRKLIKVSSGDVTEIEDPTDVPTNETFLNILQSRTDVDIFDLCDELSCSPNLIADFIHTYRDKGYEIIWQDNKMWLSKGSRALINGADKLPLLMDGKEISIGIMSDLHFGSRSVQITAMNEFLIECKKQDVKNIFVPGDVLAGFNIYKGQTMEIYEQSAEHQEESCLVNLPTGFKYHLLGGNHDYSFMKIAGHNAIRSICNRREDFIYCGFDWAEIEILKGVSIGLWHPSGGVPYSVSYRLQKGVEQVAFDELTKMAEGKRDQPSLRLLFAGHLHIQMQALFGSILGMQCGCFEGSNSYLKAKKLVPAIGGYILHLKLGRNGLLQRFSPTFYLYPEIKNDFKNYNHHLKKNEKLGPLYEW